METLQMLAVALGLASLAGLNLYLTVLVTGLAVRFHWVILSPQYHSLEILGHPAILITAGVLYLIEFIADKVPWVDSLWDSIHTVIRPVGGVLLALRVMGQTNPVMDVVVALLAGGATLITHGTKAGTRLVANGSPEPISNIGLSLLEDLVVIGGLALIHFNPILALVVILLFFTVILYFAPKLMRGTRVILWLAWKKLNAPPATDAPAERLPDHLPSGFSPIFDKLNLLGETIEWAVPCISGASRQFPANLSGWLVATKEEPHKLYFVAKNGWKRISETLDLESYTAGHESKFLSENLVIESPEKRPRFVFQFDRTREATVSHLAERIERRLGKVLEEADGGSPS
ncbi:MAG: DUF4126 domain-containing protein [Verrucomicrobiota bacterium]